MSVLPVVALLACMPVTIEVTEPDMSEVRFDPTLLRISLVLRLVEEGYCVVPPETGSRALGLSVRPEELRLMIEARGNGIVKRCVESGPAGALYLEVLHRAIQALDVVRSDKTPPEVPGQRVAISLGEVEDEDEARDLHGLLALGLVSSGRVLVSARTFYDRLLCLSTSDDEVVVEMGGPGKPCGEDEDLAISRDAGESEGSLDERLLAGAVSLLELPVSEVAQEEEEREDAGQIGVPGSQGEEGRGEPENQWSLEWTGGGGMLGRTGGLDPSMHLHARVTSSLGPGLMMAAAIIPSGARSLSVVETLLEAGPGWTLALGRTRSLSLFLMGGMQLHYYQMDGGEADSRYDWSLSLPLEITQKLHRWRLRLALAPGITGMKRSHMMDGEVLWERSATRIGAMLGLGYSSGGSDLRSEEGRGWKTTRR